MKTTKNTLKMTVYSRSPIQTFDKTNTLLNLIREQGNIDKIYLYAKFICMQNLFLFVRFKWTQVWIFGQKAWRCRNKTFQWPKCIYWVFKYYEWCLWEYWWLQPKQTKKSLIEFDDMIADIMIKRKFGAIIKKLFIRCRKLSILLMFIPHSYFSVPKDVRLNWTHYFTMKTKIKK